MSVTQKMQAQGGKPTGWLGTLVGRMMNLSHRRIQRWAFQALGLPGNAVCLDVGCGGGDAVRQLAARAPRGHVDGLDHSPEMVALARRTNRDAVARRLVTIHQGNVSALPFSDDRFDCVAALETVQFWPDLLHDLAEVRRVLQPGGTFLILNRYPPEGSSWADFLQIKSAAQYEELLHAAGFEEVATDTETHEGWIRVLAK